MSSSKWFYTNNGSSRPRATMDELIGLFHSGIITEKTYVWHKRFCQTWTQLVNCEHVMANVAQSYNDNDSTTPPLPTTKRGAANDRKHRDSAHRDVPHRDAPHRDTSHRDTSHREHREHREHRDQRIARSQPSIIRTSASSNTHVLPNIPMNPIKSDTVDSTPSGVSAESPKQSASTASDTRHSSNNMSSNETSEMNEIVANDIDFSAITESEEDMMEKRKLNVVPHIIDDGPATSTSSKVQGYRSSGSLKEQYPITPMNTINPIHSMNQSVSPNLSPNVSPNTISMHHTIRRDDVDANLSSTLSSNLSANHPNHPRDRFNGLNPMNTISPSHDVSALRTRSTDYHQYSKRQTLHQSTHHRPNDNIAINHSNQRPLGPPRSSRSQSAAHSHTKQRQYKSMKSSKRMDNGPIGTSSRSRASRAVSAALENPYSRNNLVEVSDASNGTQCYGLVVDVRHQTVCIKFNTKPYETRWFDVGDPRISLVEYTRRVIM